ncbi:hypothetical protein AB6A40_008496 [Gnathostoma spinigerum]|uniref:Trehalase n=1 Tax=Gnathostoma spinigerum TaxID=75299 RepID=A0ABD6EYV9_9BILA
MHQNQSNKTVSGSGSTSSGGRGLIVLPSMDDVVSSEVEPPQYSCDESDAPNYMIYCQGEVLHAVMMLNIYKDSKTFVDKPLKKDPEVVLAEFKKKFPKELTTNDREAVKTFIQENFDDEGSELGECKLDDWEEEPEQLIGIEDPQLRQFALDVNGMWNKLCRTFKPNVLNHPNRYSVVYVPNEFIIPGGRFREYYYWDTYWVVKGLLASDKNFIYYCCHYYYRYHYQH